jgi:hypothetical protein
MIQKFNPVKTAELLNSAAALLPGHGGVINHLRQTFSGIGKYADPVCPVEKI